MYHHDTSPPPPPLTSRALPVCGLTIRHFLKNAGQVVGVFGVGGIIFFFESQKEIILIKSQNIPS